MEKITKDIVETCVFLSGTIWLIFKFLRDKNIRHLLPALALSLFALRGWPFYFPWQIAFGSMLILAGGFCLYESFFMQNKKERSAFAYYYIILFVGTGLMLVAEGINKMC